MAACDYRLCDVCGGKAFYDSNLNYETGRDVVGFVRNAGVLMSETKLDRLGDWTVLCHDCSLTHRCVIVPREATP